MDFGKPELRSAREVGHVVDKCDYSIVMHVWENNTSQFNPNPTFILIYFSTFVDMLLHLPGSFYISHSFPVEETQYLPSTLHESFSFNLEYHFLSLYLVFFPSEIYPSLYYLFLIYVPLASYSSRVLTLVCNGLHFFIYISLPYVSQLRTDIITGWLIIPSLLTKHIKDLKLHWRSYCSL